MGEFLTTDYTEYTDKDGVDLQEGLYAPIE
jgi:hypothetical protein